MNKKIISWNDVPIVMDLNYCSRIVGQSAEYLKKRAQKGNFPAYKEGCEWRVAKTTLIKYISSQEVKAFSGGNLDDK